MDSEKEKRANQWFLGAGSGLSGMLSSPHSTEDSDDVATMARYPIEMKTENCYMPQVCGRQKHTSEHHSFRNSTRPDYEFAYEHARAKLEQHELDKRRRRRAKMQLQHCPSCNCMPEPAIHLAGRTKYSENVDEVLENYEQYLTNPINETNRCSCSHAMPNAYHQSRKGSASDHRHPRRNEHAHTFLSTLENIGNSEAVDSVETGCRHMPSTKNSFKKGNHWRSCQMRTELCENFHRGRDTLAKSTQHGRDHVPRSEPRTSRQPTEQTSKLVLNSVPLGNVEDDREEAVKRNPNDLLSASVNTVRPNSTRRSDLQTSLKSNTTDDVSKFNALPINLDDGQKQTEGTRFYKTRKPSTILRSSACRPNDEFPIIREEIQEDTHCEIIVKDNDQGTTIRKNIYAGGDLDLHASKNHILGLIDRALSNEFGTSMDHQGNIDPSQELTQQEICIEITRAMQGDCCQSLAEDLLSHRGPKADFIKHLQIIRWEHMNHIQDEFRKLCSLQKFLDNCSSGQSLPTVQPHLGAVEQQPQERQQQQYDEKQSP